MSSRSAMIMVAVLAVADARILSEDAECFYASDQKDYKGTNAVTERGNACDKWLPEDNVGDHNYCRNTDNSPKAWCRSRGSYDWCNVEQPKSCLGGPNMCVDKCVTANNGICEDGGLKSVKATCILGSDCADCGPRGDKDYSLCKNTCGSSNYDGVCDDGGSNSVDAVCPFGTDCADCGNRTIADVDLCTNDCDFKDDGACDDGGPGSQVSVCKFGSDCNDCGVRTAQQVKEYVANSQMAVEDEGYPLLYYYSDADNLAFDDDFDEDDIADDLYYNDGFELDMQYYDLDEFADDFDVDWDELDEDFLDDDFSDDNEIDDFQPTDLDPDDDDFFPALGEGIMEEPEEKKSNKPVSCSEDCPYSKDNQCDDGGPGSTNSVCTLGTDCTDCGPRDATGLTADQIRERLAKRKSAKPKQGDQQFVNVMATLVMVAIVVTGVIIAFMIMKRGYFMEEEPMSLDEDGVDVSTNETSDELAKEFEALKAKQAARH